MSRGGFNCNRYSRYLNSWPTATRLRYQNDAYYAGRDRCRGLSHAVKCYGPWAQHGARHVHSRHRRASSPFVASAPHHPATDGGIASGTCRSGRELRLALNFRPDPQPLVTVLRTIMAAETFEFVRWLWYSHKCFDNMSNVMASTLAIVAFSLIISSVHAPRCTIASPKLPFLFC